MVKIKKEIFLDDETTVFYCEKNGKTSSLIKMKFENEKEKNEFLIGITDIVKNIKKCDLIPTYYKE